MEGTRSRRRQSTSKEEEESASEGSKRKLNLNDTTSPVAKRTRNKKGYISSLDSGTEDERRKDSMPSRNKRRNVSSSESGTEEERHNDEAYKQLNEENQKLKAELDAIKTEFYRVTQENSRNKTLENDLGIAQRKVEVITNDARNQIVNLEKELRAAQEELDSLAMIKTESAHRIALQQELNDACVEIDKLKSENVSLCDELEGMRKENHVAERNGLMKALTHACAELDKVRIEIADMKAAEIKEEEDVADEVKSLQDEIKTLQVENAQRNGLHLALTHACSELDKVREENANLKKIGSSRDSRDNPLDLSGKTQVYTTDDAQDEMDRLRAEIAHLRAAPPMVVTVAASPSGAVSPEYAHAEINRLQNQVAQMKEYQEETERMKSDIDQLQQDNQKMAGLQVALSHACNEVDKLRDEITEEKSLSSAMHTQITRQRELERQLNSAHLDIDKLRVENSQRSMLEKQLNSAFVEIENLRHANAERNRLEMDLIATHTEVDRLKLDMKQARTGIIHEK